MLYMDPVTINAFSSHFIMDPVTISAGCAFTAVLTGLVLVILGALVMGVFSLIRTAGDCPAFKSAPDFSRHQIAMPKLPRQIIRPKSQRIVLWDEPSESWDAPEDISHGVPMSMKRKFHTTFK
jgi:hypothetical protein